MFERSSKTHFFTFLGLSIEILFLSKILPYLKKNSLWLQAYESAFWHLMACK